MLRRRFLEVLGKAGTGGALALELGCVRDTPAAVSFQVSGFTCITCATGLETLLGREKGIVAVAASYARAHARVIYAPKLTTPSAIAEKISAMGFKAEQVLDSPAERIEGERNQGEAPA